jgi:hypothetical protein
VTGFAPDDDRPHVAVPSSAWTESWEWRLVVPDASLVLTVAVVRRPAEGRVSYLAGLFGHDRPTVSVIEHDVVAPRDGSLELRGSGIWADHVCETPFSHWSLGLEAFGLTLDDPADAVGHGRGIPTPMGLDTEWEDEGAPLPLVSGDGYLVVGRAHGEILVGAEEHDVVGAGHRLHRWGTGPRLVEWWGSGTRAGQGTPVAGSGAGRPRAMADDGSGSVIEWVVSSEEPGGTSAPLVSSRSGGLTTA